MNSTPYRYSAIRCGTTFKLEKKDEKDNTIG